MYILWGQNMHWITLAHLMLNIFWITVFVYIPNRTRGLWSLKDNKKQRIHFSFFKWETIEIFSRNLQDTASSDRAQISIIPLLPWQIQQSILTRSSSLAHAYVLHTQQATCGFAMQRMIVQKARAVLTEGFSANPRQLVSDQFILDQ